MCCELNNTVPVGPFIATDSEALMSCAKVDPPAHDHFCALGSLGLGFQSPESKGSAWSRYSCEAFD